VTLPGMPRRVPSGRGEVTDAGTPRSSGPAGRWAFSGAVENASESESSANPARMATIVDVCSDWELRIIFIPSTTEPPALEQDPQQEPEIAESRAPDSGMPQAMSMSAAATHAAAPAPTGAGSVAVVLMRLEARQMMYLSVQV